MTATNQPRPSPAFSAPSPAAPQSPPHLTPGSVAGAATCRRGQPPPRGFASLAGAPSPSHEERRQHQNSSTRQPALFYVTEEAVPKLFQLPRMETGGGGAVPELAASPRAPPAVNLRARRRQKSALWKSCCLGRCCLPCCREEIAL